MIRNILFVALGGAIGAVVRSLPRVSAAVLPLSAPLQKSPCAMMKTGDVLLSAAYIGISVAVAVVAVFFGMYITE
ncbi:MAG: hypothetical protein SOZ80_07535 [Prevotella sp.]|nr:hypothetical protein [Prevotella sp.]MDD7317546.1 hypothetical protein [Prevotellaceae bacterium]MDY4020607.1 hypothetical protein [Prevotella sp.]